MTACAVCLLVGAQGVIYVDVQSNWYETFFHGVAVDLWLNALPPEHTRREADQLEKLLGVQDRNCSTCHAARAVFRSSSRREAIG